jgi:large subunit ribosomal protein L1
MNENILKAIEEARKNSKKRNFVQTFDLIVTLRGIDVKKPENRFVEEVELPHGKGKDSTVVVFSDAIKDVDVRVIKGREIKEFGKNKRAAKKLASNVDFFLADPPLMPEIGRHLGQFLGPRGKMPKVIKGENIKKLIERYKKSVRIRVKDSPVIQCAVGNEKMKNEEIVENIVTVINFLREKLPKGADNISKVYLKLTMGKPIEVVIREKGGKG